MKETFAMTVFFIVLGYPFALIVHLIGMAWVELLKSYDWHSFISVSASGFLMGLLAITLYPDIRLSVYTYFMGGVTGLFVAMSYYYFDEE